MSRGFEAYEQNAGKRHPLAPDVVTSKRDVGNLPLTSEMGLIWYGKISVGTPPVGFSA